MILLDHIAAVAATPKGEEPTDSPLETPRRQTQRKTLIIH